MRPAVLEGLWGQAALGKELQFRTVAPRKVKRGQVGGVWAL